MVSSTMEKKEKLKRRKKHTKKEKETMDAVRRFPGNCVPIARHDLAARVLLMVKKVSTHGKYRSGVGCTHVA